MVMAARRHFLLSFVYTPGWPATPGAGALCFRERSAAQGSVRRRACACDANGRCFSASLAVLLYQVSLISPLLSYPSIYGSLLLSAATAVFALHSLYLERGQRSIAAWFAENLAQQEPEQAESSGFVPWRDTRLTRFWGSACAEAIAALVELPLLAVS